MKKELSKETKSKVIGYARVSTQEQAAEGVSLDAQRAKIEAYCALNDLTLVDVETDEGISAKNMNRPGLTRVIEMARRKEVDGIVILKLDRMFRNTVDALTTAKDFDRRGVALHSINEKLDTQSAMGRFFFTLMAGLAEMERGIISERTSSAMQYMKAQGERVGTLSFGSRLAADGVHVEPEPVEVAALAVIKTLNDMGFSMAQIAAELTRQGFRTRRGNEWRKSNIQNLLKSA